MSDDCRSCRLVLPTVSLELSFLHFCLHLLSENITLARCFISFSAYNSTNVCRVVYLFIYLFSDSITAAQRLQCGVQNFTYVFWKRLQQKDFCKFAYTYYLPLLSPNKKMCMTKYFVYFHQCLWVLRNSEN